MLDLIYELVQEFGLSESEAAQLVDAFGDLDERKPGKKGLRVRSLIHCKGGYDMKNANCPRFMVEFAGYVNKQCAGLASWDYYGARIRKTVASLEKGLISIDEAMQELVRVSDDIRAEKESGVE